MRKSVLDDYDVNTVVMPNIDELTDFFEQEGFPLPPEKTPQVWFERPLCFVQVRERVSRHLVAYTSVHSYGKAALQWRDLLVAERLRGHGIGEQIGKMILEQSRDHVPKGNDWAQVFAFPRRGLAPWYRRIFGFRGREDETLSLKISARSQAVP